MQRWSLSPVSRAKACREIDYFFNSLLGVGGEVDLMAFMVSRYFGLRCFGAIYATMFTLFSLGVGLGPYLLGLSYDKFGSYVPMMMVNLGFIVVMCALLLILGPYRFGKREAPPTAAMADVPAE
jgi:MFS family permease